MATIPAKGLGRPKEGLSIFILMTLNVSLEKITFPVCYGGSFVLGGWQFDHHKCLVTLQSKKAATKVLWESFEQYVSVLILDHSEAMVLLMGDLNARLDPDNSYPETNYRKLEGIFSLQISSS